MPRMTFTNLLGADVSIGNADGYGKSFTIPAAGSTVDLTGVQLESDGPQLEAMKDAGYITWVKTDNPAIEDDLEILAGIPRALIVKIGPVAAKSTTAVHASVFGDAVGPVTLSTGLTNPVTPRNITATTGATYDGGIVTIHGTNQFDAAQTEAITPVAGTTVLGVKVFKTVTSVTYPGGGVGTHSTNTLLIGDGDKIALAYNVSDTNGMLMVGTTPEAITLDVTNDAFNPTTTPSATTYTVLFNVVAS